jgi:acetate kinase
MQYGFHGTSYKYVSEETARVMGKPLDELNIIACHIGNGASMAAIKVGR